MKKLIIVAVALLVLAACGGGESDFANPAFGEVTAEGEALALFTDPTADPAVGQPAPAISGVDYNGEPVSFTPGESPTVLIFLAHWCPHCQSEVPELVDWFEANPDTLGLDIYGVATGTQQGQPNYPPAPWLDREGWDQAVIMDDDSFTAAERFGLTSYPFWVIVDSEGTVAARAAGGLPPEQIDALMNAASEL